MITTSGLGGITKVVGYVDTPASFTYMAFGSGTTAAAMTQTALVSQTGDRVAATATVASVVRPNDTVIFSGEATPTADGTMTEIGVFTAATGGTMLLRRLLVPAKTYKADEKLSLIAQVTIKNYACGTGATW